MICRKVALDVQSGIGVMVSFQPDEGRPWISLDFESAVGRTDDHGLTLQQADQLVVALAEICEAAHTQRGDRAVEGVWVRVPAPAQ